MTARSFSNISVDAPTDLTVEFRHDVTDRPILINFGLPGSLFLSKAAAGALMDRLVEVLIEAGERDAHPF